MSTETTTEQSYLPATVDQADVPEAVGVLTIEEQHKAVARLRIKLLLVVGDALDVIERALKRKRKRYEFTGKDGQRIRKWKEVSKLQIMAANAVLRFAPTLEAEASGAVHLHLNVPRPPRIPKTPTIVDSSKSTP